MIHIHLTTRQMIMITNGGSTTYKMNRPEYIEGEMQSVEKKHKHFIYRSVDNFTNK